MYADGSPDSVDVELPNSERANVLGAHGVDAQGPAEVVSQNSSPAAAEATNGMPMMVERRESGYQQIRESGIVGSLNRGSGVDARCEVLPTGPNVGPELDSSTSMMGQFNDGVSVIVNETSGPSLVGLGLPHDTDCLGSSPLLGSTQKTGPDAPGLGDCQTGEADVKKQKCGTQEGSQRIGKEDGFRSVRLEEKGKEIVYELQEASVGGSFVQGMGVQASGRCHRVVFDGAGSGGLPQPYADASSPLV
uniref:Uncharacterized protein n=1 Tax=Cannabis sativa TaxID=3483 RepID=A0A803NV72_CANSA